MRPDLQKRLVRVAEAVEKLPDVQKVAMPLAKTSTSNVLIEALHIVSNQQKPALNAALEEAKKKFPKYDKFFLSTILRRAMGVDSYLKTQNPNSKALTKEIESIKTWGDAKPKVAIVNMLKRAVALSEQRDDRFRHTHGPEASLEAW